MGALNRGLTVLTQKQDSQIVIHCRGSCHESDGEALIVIKIADFGLTQRVQDGKPIFLSVKVSLKKGEDKLILY